MQPARENITVIAGVTFEKIVELQDENGDPRDLTTWTGAFTIRDSADDEDVLAEGDVTCTSAGLVTATIPASETLDMVWYAGVYDLTISSGARVEPLVEGRAVLRRAVSR